LLGNYFDNPLSAVVYAISVAIVSGLEVVLFRHAHRRGLLTRSMPSEVYRYGLHASLSPVIFFLLSLPLAFVHTGLAVAAWFGAVPYQLLILQRRKPAQADEFL
jgi:hypothetical protein